MEFLGGYRVPWQGFHEVPWNVTEFHENVSWGVTEFHGRFHSKCIQALYNIVGSFFILDISVLMCPMGPRMYPGEPRDPMGKFGGSQIHPTYQNCLFYA